MVGIINSKFTSLLLHPLKITHRSCRFFWKKKSNKDSEFLIMRAMPKDYSQIVKLMLCYYFPEEPTVRALGLGRKSNPILEHHVYTQLEERISLIARCKHNGDISAAAVNRTACPWDPDLTDKFACTLSCQDTRSLYQFYAYVQRAPCLWEKYCCSKIFEVSELVVRGCDRGKGLGLALLNASRELGADCGYRIIRADATSNYTAQICEKLKMQMVHEIPYCKYVGKGPSYVPIFKPPHPHESCKVYIDTPFHVG